MPINIQNLTKAVQMVLPAMGPAGAVVGSMVQGIAGAQKGLDQAKGALDQLLKGPFSQAGGGSGAQQGQAASRPQPFSSQSINLHILINPVGAMQQGPSASGPLQSFGKLPEVGSDSQWGGFANAANSRITGNDKSHNFNGTNPWQGGGDKSDMAAVGWAMQKNDKVRFNSDSKQFYVTNADGSTKNVASLDEVKQQIAKAGGANPGNGAAFNAVGSFINSRVNNSQSAASQPAGQQGAQQAAGKNPMEQIVELLKKLLEMLTGGAKGGEAAGAQAKGSSASSSVPASGPSSPAAGGAGPGGADGSKAASEGKGAVDGDKKNIDSMIDRVGSKIDSMFAEAEKLMASDKPSDQLKAQRMMQQANRMFEMMSKMIEDIGKKSTSTLKRSDYQPA